MDDHHVPYASSQWPPHLLHAQQHSSPYPSPTTAVPPTFPDTQSAYYHHPQPPPSTAGSLPRSASGLSLSISTLSVASSNAGSVPSTAGALSPVTPLSPTSSSHLATQQLPTPNGSGGYAIQHQHHPNTFRFAPPDIVPYDSTPQSNFDSAAIRRPPGSSRSSSSSEKSVPRKRSITTTAPSMLNVEEEEADVSFDDPHGSIDDSDMCYGTGLESGSPSSADEYRIMEGQLGMTGQQNQGPNQTAKVTSSQSQLPSAHSAPASNNATTGGTYSVLGKSSGTNNFVSKLYQMINDPKSAQYISWTELGTSFMVSNVGEFSRSILGSHFKHNNFSSFVRQLNMYGFHKINRTPRAQRTSTDAQTWEFSHPKFLRGRMDLLEDIKRKSLEQDLATLKQRIELPAEVASQLTHMREEHLRTAEKLEWERRKSEKLVDVVKCLWEVVERVLPGQLPMGFPAELLHNNEPDAAENPPILITEHEEMSDDIERPSTSRQCDPQPQTQPSTRPSTAQSSTHGQSLNTISLMAPRYGNPAATNGLSPSSSPTMSDFPHPAYQFDHRAPPYDPHQPNPFDPPSTSTSTTSSQDLSTSSQPQQQPNGLTAPAIQQQPQPQETEPSPKRQRISRARSDSAPLGLGYSGWHVPNQGGNPPGGVAGNVFAAAHGHMGRPRSGSNLPAVRPGASPMASQVFLGRYGSNPTGAAVKSEDSQRG